VPFLAVRRVVGFGQKGGEPDIRCIAALHAMHTKWGHSQRPDQLRGSKGFDLGHTSPNRSFWGSRGVSLVHLENLYVAIPSEKMLVFIVIEYKSNFLKT
tara:strand:- start:658 stop:954 length:297 start_codon:yes stop_codon:yes gene_type:complete